MMGEVIYRMEYLPHPFDEKQRKAGLKAWCLMKLVRLESRRETSFETVAIFNLDSEAEIFQEHVFKGGKVELTKEMRDALETIARPR